MPKLPNPFRKPTIQEVRARTIADIELALHEAQLNEERWAATVAMHTATLTRLRASYANP